MAYVDQTALFRSLVDNGAAATPGSSRPASRNARRRARPQDADSDDNGAFLKEAYQIYGHLADLGEMLRTIRKPYLSTAEPPPTLAARSRRAAAGAPGDGEEDLRRYQGTKYLSERERDEIDVRAKMILRRCRERVGLLEEQERLRKQKVAQATPAIYSFFPSLVPTTVDNSAALTAAHRAGVIWTLTSMLAKLSAAQTDMQEERAKRRAERARTLGGGAEREAVQMRMGAGAGVGTGAGAGASRGSASATPLPSASAAMAFGIVPPYEPPIEEQLSAAQLQQFESENNALLDHMQAQLDAVLAAEKSLLEISGLQTELVRHLAQQTEITDRLYDEAVGSVAEMGKANVQLRQAKERSGEARLFLLVFLFSASFALLFLNWYA